MGSFYVNIAVRDVPRATIIDWVAARCAQAAIGPEIDGWTVFTDPRLEQQDYSYIEATLNAVTHEFACAALAVLVHDEDFVCFWAGRAGTLLASYNSSPGYFAEDPSDADLSPKVHGLEGFASLFGGRVTQERLSEILRIGVTEYVDVWTVQSDLSRATGWPDYAAGFGYRYATRGEAPEGTTFHPAPP